MKALLLYPPLTSADFGSESLRNLGWIAGKDVFVESSPGSRQSFPDASLVVPQSAKLLLLTLCWITSREVKY